MSSFFSTCKGHFNKYFDLYVVSFLLLISLFCTWHFFRSEKILLYGDSLSRLNISRKIFDNITPGLAQIGNVWLPLPQLAMMPFVANNFLWHTGLAGSIVSALTFVLGGLYLYRSIFLLSKSKITGAISICIYALNINLMYLQTTAMSESFFLCAVSASIYYFIKWLKTGNKIHLIPAAIAVSAMTLIRYEALGFLFASIPMVFIFTLYEKRNYHKAEGNAIVYASLACLGFALWSLYLAAIFGDPLFWKNYYIGTHVLGDSNTQLHIFTHHLNFIEAVWKYLTAVVWMNGLIPTAIATLGIPILLWKSYKQKNYYFLPVLLSFSMFAFMVLTLQRNTPIDQPQLSIQALRSDSTSNFPEFNISYGLLMLPVIVLLFSYAFNTQYKLVKVLLVLLFSVQVYSYFYPTYSVIYQIPISIGDNITQGTLKEKQMVEWMKTNYDNGYIMISALKHDPQMLQFGLDYRNYIHEGTGKYWKESTRDPQRYAKWIIFDSYNKDDQVTKYLFKSLNLDFFYIKVYDNDGMFVYKIKTHPDIIIPQN